MRHFASSCFLAVSAAIAYPAGAQVAYEQFQIHPDQDASFYEDFASSVACNDSYLMIGSPGYNSSNGAVFVYDSHTGQMLHEFLPTTTHSYSYGRSVALSGTKAIVGGPLISDETPAGAAYVYDLTTGSLIHVLTPSDGRSQDRFGYAVASWGDLVVVSAIYGDPGDGSRAGAAYVFDINTGQELRKLVVDGQVGIQSFGYCIAMYEQWAVIGWPYADNSGRAYVFNTLTGDLIHEFRGDDEFAGEYFGKSVAIYGDKVLVGEP